MSHKWQITSDGLGVRTYKLGRIKVFDYRSAPVVGQHLAWIVYGHFGRIQGSGFATTLRQAKKDALRLVSEGHRT